MWSCVLVGLCHDYRTSLCFTVVSNYQTHITWIILTTDLPTEDHFQEQGMSRQKVFRMCPSCFVSISHSTGRNTITPYSGLHLNFERSGCIDTTPLFWMCLGVISPSRSAYSSALQQWDQATVLIYVLFSSSLRKDRQLSCVHPKMDIIM